VEDVGSILIVDPSESGSETLRSLLLPHAQRVHVAASADEARERLEAEGSIGLVLCNADLAEGGAFELLDWIQDHASVTARVMLLSPWWIPSDAERANAQGALAYLVRPVSVRDIVRAWTKAQMAPDAFRPRTERRPLAKVWLIEPGERDRYVLCWDLYDVSLTGAFLETRGPLVIGSELVLEIIFGKRVVRARTEVVRVQEPSWMHVAGVGVRFLEMDERSRRVLEEFVHQSVVVTDGGV